MPRECRGPVALLLANLLGSNAFNALAVVGFAAIAGRMRGAAVAVSAPALWVVIAAAGATMAIGAWVWIAPRIGRVAGVLFVLVYVAMVPSVIAGS